MFYDARQKLLWPLEKMTSSKPPALCIHLSKSKKDICAEGARPLRIPQVLFSLKHTNINKQTNKKNPTYWQCPNFSINWSLLFSASSVFMLTVPKAAICLEATANKNRMIVQIIQNSDLSHFKASSRPGNVELWETQQRQDWFLSADNYLCNNGCSSLQNTCFEQHVLVLVCHGKTSSDQWKRKITPKFSLLSNRSIKAQLKLHWVTTFNFYWSK